jgi:hypothetical protein
MTAWIVPPVGLIEPVVAPEFYVDGIGAIEMVGNCVRIYLVTEQMPLEASGNPQKIVSVKIIGPLPNVPGVIGQLAQCLSGIFPGPPGPRLVR